MPLLGIRVDPDMQSQLREIVARKKTTVQAFVMVAVKRAIREVARDDGRKR